VLLFDEMEDLFRPWGLAQPGRVASWRAGLLTERPSRAEVEMQHVADSGRH